MQHELRVAHSNISRKLRSDDGQLVFTGGSGGTVSDHNGHSYHDFVLGYGPVILGHAVEEFSERIAKYLSHGVMMPGYTVFHEEYLTRLLATRPGHRAAFFKTASEAVTAAFRLGAAVTGRRGVIRCGYVGWHDAQIATSPRWHEPLRSPLRAQMKYTEGMRGVGPNEPALNWIDLCLDTLASLLDTHRGALGCFVFDAYLASMTTVDLIREALTLCREAGLMTVFDETKTGGRISPLGYAQDNNIETDLMVIGKALANGAPLSLLVGNAELLSIVERSRLSGTFSKEMLAIYAALSTLDALERTRGGSGDGWSELAELGQRVTSTINRAARLAGAQDLVSAVPLFGGSMFELSYADHLLADRTQRNALGAAFSRHGVLLIEGHPSFVCLAHRDLDWNRLGDQVRRAFREWLGEDGQLG